MAYSLLFNDSTLQRAKRLAAVQRVIGVLLMLFSLTMLPPLALNFLYGEDAATPFLVALCATFASGALIWWPVRRTRLELKTRDGFLITVLFWTVLSIYGAIPLYLSDTVWFSYTDALFESVSGLTTTGATTVAYGLDDLPHAINYYRAQLEWLGGMGIIVLAVAILPILGVGGMQMYRAETPGPMKDARLTPRITGTARALWVIYVLLTGLCALTYWLLGMSGFDAICHAMTTLATGGFSTHDGNISHFNSAKIEFAMMVFLILGATNFSLHFIAWRERGLGIYRRDTEFRTFLLILVAMALLVCVPMRLLGTYDSWGSILRTGLFQLVSYATTSGFWTVDPSGWPIYVPQLLIMATFMATCSGGTGGGVKVVRLVLFLRQALREMKRLVHPSAEVAIKLDGKPVPNDVVYAVGGFFSVYIGFTILLSLLLMITGMDAITAFSATAACINNAGVALYAFHDNFGAVSDFGKWVLTFAMLLGRLEIFTLLIVFTPAFWRR